MTSTRDDGRPRSSIIVLAGAAIGVASGLVAVQVLGSDQPHTRRLVLFLANFVYWLTWSQLALVVIALAWKLPLTGEARRRALAIHAAASLAFPFVHMPLFTVLMTAIRGLVLGTPVQPVAAVTELAWLSRGQIEWEITMYWALVGLTHALAFRADGRARALQAVRLDAELSQARLQALQQQMHPHFLFNTLQSITVLMHRDRDAAEEMLSRLGDLLRGSLRSPSTLLVPLSRELEYVGHYLCIEQMNIGDRLRVERDIAPEAVDCLVPELLLQPLVENAVRHGIAPAMDGGTVRIRARRERGRLLIEVQDNGVGPGKSPGGAGIALQNIRRRLELAYGEAHAFEITPSPRGMEVRLNLPAAGSEAVA